ncbi:MAG: WD40 repeat domain-containing protein, partial [Maioricimonas sp. JB049]
EPHRFNGIDQIAFSRDVTELFVASHRVGNLSLLGRRPTTFWIECWNTADWRETYRLDDFAAPLTLVGQDRIAALPVSRSLAGPPFGRIGTVGLATVPEESVTRSFELESGYVSGLALSPDGQSLVVCSVQQGATVHPDREGCITSWGINGRQLWKVCRERGQCSSIVFARDGSTVIAAGPGGVAAWEADTGNLVWEHDDHPNWIESLAVSPDGRHLITGSYGDPSAGLGLFGSVDAVVRIRNVVDGSPVRTVTLDRQGVIRPLDLAICSESRHVAVALGSYNRGQKWGEIRIVAIQTGEVRATLLQDHPQPVTAVAFSPDGRYLAAGTADGYVRIWRMVQDGG